VRRWVQGLVTPVRVRLSLRTPEAGNGPTTFDRLADALKPYKIRSLSSGSIKIVVLVPYTVGKRTVLMLEDDELSWVNPQDAPHHINSNYEFVGPLEPGESVTISG
jgi:hypothetical protein